MHTPKKLFKIIKINSVILAFYLALRTTLFFKYCVNADLFIQVPAFLLSGVIGYCLSKNIWSTTGMLFMSFMLMLMTSDVIMLIIKMLGFPLSDLIIDIWLGGLIALVMTLLFLGYGYLNERMVKRNVLKIQSNKVNKTYKFAVLSDIHFGTIQPEHILVDTINKINNENYDGVLLIGDIAEEHTSHDDLLKLFDELGRLKSNYGSYFVHGNHDKQEKLSEKERTYTDEEFNELLDKAKIKCIDDCIIDLTDDIELIGRNDYSFENRKEIKQLLAESSANKLRILIEHQPIDYAKAAKEGVEVILSGHYHGAQNWPNNLIYKLAGIRYNGKYLIGNSLLYVNAGLTGSKYKVRTHGHCEYLCLEITNLNN